MNEHIDIYDRMIGDEFIESLFEKRMAKPSGFYYPEDEAEKKKRREFEFYSTKLLALYQIHKENPFPVICSIESTTPFGVLKSGIIYKAVIYNSSVTTIMVVVGGLVVSSKVFFQNFKELNEYRNDKIDSLIDGEK
jgi:hypothetical protein